MKLNPAWLLGSGGIYHDQYPFLLSHIPCNHLWSGHYSCPFPEQFQRGWAELLWLGGPEQLQRGWAELLWLGGPEQLQRGSRDQEPPYRKSGTQYSTLMPIQREYWFGGVIYHD